MEGSKKEEPKKDAGAVKEADVSEPVEISLDENESDQSTRKKNRKYDFYIEIVLFLVAGFLIGIAMKTEAVKKITVGFDDHLMVIKKTDYNINLLQEELAKKRAEVQSEAQKDQSENLPGEGENVDMIDPVNGKETSGTE